jgi:hypothetical protein
MDMGDLPISEGMELLLLLVAVLVILVLGRLVDARDSPRIQLALAVIAFLSSIVVFFFGTDGSARGWRPVFLFVLGASFFYRYWTLTRPDGSEIDG